MADFNGGQAAQGAMGGAMAGTAVMPGIGTLIGGAAGGLLGGLFGGGNDAEQKKLNEYEQMLKQLAAGYGRRTAPQMQSRGASDSMFRQNQAGLISQLEAMGRGEGPSAARMQMQDAMDRAAGAQSSAAAGAGGRGVNAGAAMRNAMNNTAAIQSQGARDTAMIRANEQLGALNQLGDVVGQARGQDQQTSQFNANAYNQGAANNLQAKLQTMGMNQQGELQALLSALGIQQQQAAQAAAQPGLGTQIMAGGAAAAPGLSQMFGAKPGAGQWANGQGSLYGMGSPRMASAPSQWNNQGPGLYDQFTNWLGSQRTLPANQDPWANTQEAPTPTFWQMLGFNPPQDPWA